VTYVVVRNEIYVCIINYSSYSILLLIEFMKFDLNYMYMHLFVLCDCVPCPLDSTNCRNMLTRLGDEKCGRADINALLMTMYTVDCDFCVTFWFTLSVAMWIAFF